AVEFVREAKAQGPVLILAPSRAAADEIARIACDAALLDVLRTGFRELVTELSAGELNRRELVPVSRTVREAMAASVAATAVRRGEIGYLMPVVSFPGVPRALAATIEELRLNAVDIEVLRRGGQSGPDLANLLQRYAVEIETRLFADHALRVELARLAVGRLAETAIVAVDVAPRTRLERELLEAVMAAA